MDQIEDKFNCVVRSETSQIETLHIFQLEGYNILYTAGKFSRNDGVVVYLGKDSNYTYTIKTFSDCKQSRIWKLKCQERQLVKEINCF